ncbi:MAG: hypothetical protein ACRDN0_34495, partial [Trebonia sp.]
HRSVQGASLLPGHRFVARVFAGAPAVASGGRVRRATVLVGRLEPGEQGIDSMMPSAIRMPVPDSMSSGSE